MQPAPLAGTATLCQNLKPSRTVTPSPRCNPHPLRGRQRDDLGDRLPSVDADATRTPRGDGNPFAGGHDARVVRMQPAPLAGTATEWYSCRTSCSSDVAHAPYGDSNRFAQDTTHYSIARCNLRPSRGQQLPPVDVFIVADMMQPAPLTGTATGNR